MESGARRGHAGTSAVPAAGLPLRAHVANLWADFKPRAVLPLAQAVVPVEQDLHITVGFEGTYKRAPSSPARFISSLSPPLLLSSNLEDLPTYPINLAQTLRSGGGGPDL